MLTVSNLSKSYGAETILERISFSLNPGERLALIGPNGSGKTTLLRILAGEERPDSGSVSTSPAALRTGYLPQGLEPGPEETIHSFLSRMTGDLSTLSVRLEELARLLAVNPGRVDLQEEYDMILLQLESASDAARRLPAVLSALGLDHLPEDTPARYLSGGQKTRLVLAGVLLSDPQLLLLDEPTNHLDLEMLAWLEEWLRGFRGAVLFVSHDRAFIDAAATAVLELDPKTHTTRVFTGNYSTYLEAKVAERERQQQAYADQQEEIARLRSAAARVRGDAAFKRGGKGDSGDKFARGFFGNRSTKGTIGRAKHLEQRLERLLTEERLEKPGQDWQMKLDFGAVPESGRDVVLLEDLTVGYGDHALLHDLNLVVRAGSRLVFTGPNGSGKTTLLRTIAGRIPPLRGRVRLGPSVRVGYMAQEQENLDPELDALSTLLREAPFSETAARTFLHRFLFSGDEVFRPVGVLSYGERARLSLALLVARGCNLLLLDEPVNHLDIPSRARFEQALDTFTGTVLAVVHDRYFIDGFASAIWEVRSGTIHVHIPQPEF